MTGPAPEPLPRAERRELLAVIDEAMGRSPAARLAHQRGRCGKRGTLLRAAERLLDPADRLE